MALNLQFRDIKSDTLAITLTFWFKASEGRKVSDFVLEQVFMKFILILYIVLFIIFFYSLSGNIYDTNETPTVFP